MFSGGTSENYLQDQPIKHTVEHNDHTIPEDELTFAEVDEQGNELPPYDLVRINELSWEQRVEVYRQLAREAKDRVEAKCRRLYHIYWLQKEGVESAFIRCDHCNRPRKQAETITQILILSVEQGSLAAMQYCHCLLYWPGHIPFVTEVAQWKKGFVHYFIHGGRL